MAQTETTDLRYASDPDPEQAEQIRSTLISETNSKNLHKNINPGISERGLDIARQARPLFTKQEWKLFRKFLEKNFIKSI